MVSACRIQTSDLIGAYILGSIAGGVINYYIRYAFHRNLSIEESTGLTMKSVMLGGINGFVFGITLPIMVPLMTLTSLARLLTRIRINVNLCN